MINLLKMDFYRMLRSKSAWVILVVTMMFAGFSMSMGKADGMEPYDNGNKVEISEESINMNFGIYVNTPQSVDGTPPALLEYIQADLQSGILMIFIAIFSAVFVHAERKNGYIKNIGRIHKHKSMLVLSKIGIVIAYLAVVLVSYTLVQVLYGMHLYPDASLGITADRLQYIGIQFILMAAFAVMILFITVLFKQSEFSIAFGLLIACGIGYLFTAIINQNVPLEGFDINQYLLVATVNRISDQSSAAVLSHAFLVGAVWLVIWSGLTMLVTERRDVI